MVTCILPISRGITLFQGSYKLTVTLNQSITPVSSTFCSCHLEPRGHSYDFSMSFGVLIQVCHSLSIRHKQLRSLTVIMRLITQSLASFTLVPLQILRQKLVLIKQEEESSHSQFLKVIFAINNAVIRGKREREQLKLQVATLHNEVICVM